MPVGPARNSPPSHPPIFSRGSSVRCGVCLFSWWGVGGTNSLYAVGMLLPVNREGRLCDAAAWERRVPDKGDVLGAKCPGKKWRVCGGPWGGGGEEPTSVT